MCDLSSSSLSVESLRLWSQEALKSFLSVRKKSVEGSFDDLVARTFAALENQVPVDADAEKAARVILREYKEKLLQDGDTYPDPFTIMDGWIGEEQGRYSWPSVYISDISDYLRTTAASDVDLMHRLMNEYKEGKAYRYYACNRVREVKYHAIRPNSPVCYLAASVYPSMSRKTPYQVWVMVAKKPRCTAGGGEIQTAYCSCPAGLLGSCNHVAGLLFRVEAAVKQGATTRTSTEVECQWVVPRAAVARKPQAVQDTVLLKERYGKQTCRAKRVKAQKLKRSFVPFSKDQATLIADADGLRNSLQDLLLDVVPDSVFVRTMRNLPPQGIQEANIPLPPDPMTAAKDCVSVGQLQQKMTMPPDAAEAVELCTRKQSNCRTRFDHRRGRLTASRFYEVHTKTTSLLKERSSQGGNMPTFAETFVKEEMGTTMVPAMKHGRALEPAAKEAVKALLTKSHTNCIVADSGLVISTEHSFLAASPDLVVTCECCGDSLVEIKCPFSTSHTKPTVDNIPYLYWNENTVSVKLKTHHQYYGQVQGQLALTGRPLCHLFVFTLHGHLLVRVDFDLTFWKSMATKLEYFWTKFVAPLLLDSNCAASSASPQSSGTGPVCATSVDGDTVATSSNTCIIDTADTYTDSVSALPRLKRQVKQHKMLPVEPLYLCGSCSACISEEPDKFEECSVKCDACPQWYHLKCVGIGEGAEPTDDDAWECPKCKN